MSLANARSACVSALENISFPNVIVYENQEYKVSQIGPTWLQFFFAPNDPEVNTLGSLGNDRYRGFFQLDINTQPGDGEAETFSKYAAMRAVFFAGKELQYNGTSVLITSCGLSQGRRVDEYYRKSITVFWQTDITRTS